MLYELLDQHRAEIVDRIRTKMADREMRVSEESTIELIRFIDEIWRTLPREPDPKAVSPLSDASPTAARQGELRERTGCPATILARDFGSVCDSIAEVAIERGTPISASELKALNQGIDSGIEQALQVYQDRRLEKTRREWAEQLGGLAHELRNALSSAAGAFRLIQRGLVLPQHRSAMVLERSLKRMEGLIQSTLAEVGIEAQVVTPAQAIDVRQLTEHVLSELSCETEVWTQLELTAGLRVLTDRRLLTSVISNLIQNAQKFTRPGGRVLVTGMSRESDTLLRVEDECGGLSEKEVDNMFRAFTSSSRARSSMGLGLSIAYKAAHALGGSMALVNIPGRGCAFELTLPGTPRPASLHSLDSHAHPGMPGV